jgi:hypothetical protein
MGIVPVVTLLKMQFGAGAPVAAYSQCRTGSVDRQDCRERSLRWLPLFWLARDRIPAKAGAATEAGKVRQAARLTAGITALLTYNVKGAEETRAGEERDIRNVRRAICGNAIAGLLGWLGMSSCATAGEEAFDCVQVLTPPPPPLTMEKPSRMAVGLLHTCSGVSPANVPTVAKTPFVQLWFQGISGM